MDPTIAAALSSTLHACMAMEGAREISTARWQQDRSLDVAPLTGLTLVAFAVLIARGAGTN